MDLNQSTLIIKSKSSNKKPAYRLFFAIDLLPAIKTQLLTLQQMLQQASHGVVARAVAAQNFHITLSFVGKVNDRQMESIINEIVAPEMPLFKVNLSDLIYWPKASVVALAVNDPNQYLAQLKKQLETQLSALDYFGFDKKTYLPHLTLFRQVESPPKMPISIHTSVKVDRFSLFLSQLTPNGVNYQQLEQWSLGASIKQQLLGSPPPSVRD